MVKKVLNIFFFLLFMVVFAQAQTDFVSIEPLVTSNSVQIKQISGENLPQKVEIRVFDVFGVLLFRHLQPLDAQGKMIDFRLDLSKFAAAAYVVEIRQHNRLVKTKVVKRHH